MGRKFKSHLWVRLVLFVFSILMITSFILSTIFFFLIYKKIFFFQKPRPFFPLFVILFISVLIGTAITAIAGKRILKPITALSEAASAVAKGDFSIRLDESSSIEEIQNMAMSFNKMTRNLSAIETISNDFVANVSHEFKTPIAAIEGYAMLMQDRSLTEEEKEEYAKRILVNTKRLSTLTSNILKISRLENQGIIADKARFRLDEQLREALLLLETEWMEKNIILDIDFEPTYCYGSEGLLLQVWSNLFENAIRFTPNGGTIRCNISISNDTIMVVVTDSGIGMTEEVRKHIFEKFYRGDKARSMEGNGLGLTLVKRIVDLHGGAINVVSEPGKGSEFTVVLPQK